LSFCGFLGFSAMAGVGTSAGATRQPRDAKVRHVRA
jgi:hypothetical protein